MGNAFLWQVIIKKKKKMTYHSKLKAHYEDFWQNEGEICYFDKGPIQELPEDFGILVLPPKENTFWTYATVGMGWNVNEKRSLELHLFSPQKEEWLIELLTIVAHYHHTGSGLNLFHSVNFGASWIENSLCNHGLLSLPYLDGENLEEFHYKDKLTICLWLIPITESEFNFKKRNGIDALEELFEKHQFNYLDPHRKSVVY